MKIGIDMDDVIVDTSITMKKYIEKFDAKEDIYKHMEEVMRGETPTENINRFFKENIIEIFKNVEVKENAREVIKRLLENGNEIYIITSRGNTKDIFRGSKEITIEYLKINSINYTKVIYDSYNKAEICKENKIDIMIDDSIKHCENILNKNIKSILFTSEVNKNIETKLTRVNNWLELEKVINKIKM